jgi:hypothetical protein
LCKELCGLGERESGKALQLYQAGISIYFTKMEELIKKRDHDAGRSGKGRGYYKSSMVIVDEVGYTPVNREECNLFFRFIRGATSTLARSTRLSPEMREEAEPCRSLLEELRPLQIA